MDGEQNSPNLQRGAPFLCKPPNDRPRSPCGATNESARSGAGAAAAPPPPVPIAVGPRTGEDVEADPAEAVDIGVIDFGEEADLGWRHRVVVWEKELQLERAAYNRRRRGEAWAVGRVNSAGQGPHGWRTVWCERLHGRRATRRGRKLGTCLRRGFAVARRRRPQSTAGCLRAAWRRCPEVPPWSAARSPVSHEVGHRQANGRGPVSWAPSRRARERGAQCVCVGVCISHCTLAQATVLVVAARAMSE